MYSTVSTSVLRPSLSPLTVASERSMKLIATMFAPRTTYVSERRSSSASQ